MNPFWLEIAKNYKSPSDLNADRRTTSDALIVTNPG